MTPLDWHINSRYPDAEALCGRILRYIDADSADEIYRQLDANSISGWHPEPPSYGWELSADDCIRFPGLPPLQPCAMAVHLGERIYIYPAGFVCIVQLSGAFSIGRVL